MPNKPHVAIVTCARLPSLAPDEKQLLGALDEYGISATAAVWNDPSVDWDSFSATVLRCCWDYQDHYAEFREWLERVPRLYNSAAIVKWNLDKSYLRQLSDAGVATVPTTWLAPDSTESLPAEGEWVFKPSVGCGSRDAGRFDLGMPDEKRAAAQHVARLHANGRTVMAQPYLVDVDRNGERGLIYINGRYSHTIRKSAMLAGPQNQDAGLSRAEHIRVGEPTTAERELAAAAIDTALEVDTQPLLYARVDLVSGPDGPMVLEMELTEPSLFYSWGAGAANRMAAAIAGLT